MKHIRYIRALNLFTPLYLICFSMIKDAHLVFQFFIGAIEVRIATMSKLDRSNATEVYTKGFVPSYSLLEKRPNSLGPFLYPLITDLEKFFIEGN